MTRRLLLSGAGLVGLLAALWVGLYAVAGSGIADGTTVLGVDVGG